MIRYSFKAFLVGVLLSFTSVIFAQQKITVLDETSGFPIHDVQVSIIFTDSNFIKRNTKQDKNTIGVEQYFTNKKGKFLNVGERGGQISGGQKQRIGIARAIYRKHKLLILDESTSALDSFTEKSILNNLKILCKEEGMTIILISHRLRTLKICDEIFFIENGQLKAHDNFENLCEKSENFRNLIIDQ